MYVTAERRETGLGRKLFLAALYVSCGFRSIAIKPGALKVGDRYYDQELMALDVRPRA